MKTPAGRRTTKYSVALFGMLVITALVAIPSVQSRRLTRTSIDNPGNLKAEVDKNQLARSFGGWSWTTNVAPPVLAGETIEIFAADCTTSKTAFALGETICAKTDGVSLTPANNYYMNWIDSQLNQTNGGTITQNPQFFYFVPPTTGTWKATIGRVTPADSSIIGNPPIFTVGTGPAISTFAYDTNLNVCTNTPKTAFLLGETVCATATGTEPQFNRRFAWVGPGGITRQFTTITTDPQTDTFTLPSTDTSTINGQVFDNRGTWQARVVTSRGTGIVSTPFTVAAATPSVNLSIAKGLISGEVRSGEDVTFSVSVYNSGPNDAANVKITDATPANATFVSATPAAGSGFSCTGTATVICSSAVMKPGEQVTVDFVYTPGTAGQTITNTATVASDTQELDNEDNSATAGPYTIAAGSGGGGGGTCTLSCPIDVNVQSNTTDPGDPNQPGAVVHYDTPTTDGTCGTLTFSHCNDCFFPQGVTVVSVSETTGESCQFNVTVSAASNAPTISCPSNKEVDANGACSVVVNVGTATATGGENVTIFATRSDGKPMYNCDSNGQNCVRQNPDYAFGGGTTTITWTATSHDAAGEEIGNSSCIQTITVNNASEDTAAPVITCPANITRSNDSGQCSAAINVGTATATDNCDSNPTVEGTRSDNQSLSDPYPKGTTTIHWTATDSAGNSSSCDQTVTVNDNEAPAISCPANITRSTDSGTCSANINPGTATATDNCDSNPTITGTRSDGRPLTDTYPKGTTTITWTASDHASPANQSSCTQTITVEDHENPTISCPSNITRNNDPGVCGAVVTYATPVGSDNCPGATTAQTAGLTSGSTFPVGTTTNTFEVTDASGNKFSCSFTVTVVDNEPPVIVLNGQTPSMWPPNHKYQTFGVTNFVTAVTDNCDSISVSSVVITKVTSDEIENGNGDGNTLKDIVIAPDCKSVQLRSEREGYSNGRVYRIFFSVTDASGNVGTASSTVVVQHNPGETAVEGLPQYTVYCGNL